MWTLWRLQWHFCPWWVHSKRLEAFPALWLSFIDFALVDVWLRSTDRKISPIEFGNNHKVHLPNDDCEDPYEEDEESAETETLLDSCKEFVSFLFKKHFGILSKHSQILKKLSPTCLFFPHQRTTCEQMLHSGSWSSCTSLIDPEAYIRACVQDMCGCTNTTDYFCICSTLSEFSRQCSHAGGQPPNWRTPQFCGKMFTFTSLFMKWYDHICERYTYNVWIWQMSRFFSKILLFNDLFYPSSAKQCPFNMVYEESGSPCMDTCSHSDTSSMCEDHKMDGCFCPPGSCHLLEQIMNQAFIWFYLCFITSLIKHRLSSCQ